MVLPRNLDATDLVILRTIAKEPEVTTGEIESRVYLSRTQVLRRLQQLEKLGLITKRNGKGKLYRYKLSPNVDTEQFSKDLDASRDPVAREALAIILQGIQTICDILAEIAGRLENLLK